MSTLPVDASVSDVRREGMADAVIRIVLSRRVPFVSADDWCDILGLTRGDIEAALARLRARGVEAQVPARPALVPVASTARPFQRKDGLRVDRRAGGKPWVRKRPCPFCAVEVAHGKWWTNHMARYHPGEWEAKLEEEFTEKYGPECPECGERIKVTVHVERHECAHRDRP